MKHFIFLLIIFCTSFVLANNDVSPCETKIRKDYGLSDKFDGDLLSKKILDRQKPKPREQIIKAIYSFKQGETSNRVEFNFLEDIKTYDVQARGQIADSLPRTTAKVEDVLKKLPSPTEMVSRVSSYRLKKDYALLVYQNGGSITRVSLGQDFSCEFTDFTSCMCVK